MYEIYLKYNGGNTLWNLPRKEYNETKMWVCISGFTCNNEDFNPKHFVISDNNITEEPQKRQWSCFIEFMLLYRR